MKNLIKNSTTLVMALSVTAILSHNSIAAGNNKNFPEATFVTLKKAAQVTAFPSQNVWQGGPNMLYNAITPDGKKLLATSPSTGSVYVFDSKTGNQLAIIKVDKAPKGVKITPDGQYAYVSNEASATISVVELDNYKVIATIKTEEAPHNVRFTQDGKIAYVTLQGGAGIGVINTKTRKVEKVIPVPGIIGPHNIDLSHDEKKAFVRDFVNHVAVLDLTTDKVIKVLKVGNGHSGIDVAPNGKYVFAGGIGDRFVSVIDANTLEVIKKIDVGAGPHGLRASKDSQWLYVTITGKNEVVIIDTTSLEIVNKISVGEFPFWVAVQGNS